MRALLSVVWLSCLLLSSATAYAQESATLNRFSASAMPEDDFQIDRPITSGHLKFGAMLHLDYGLDPLIYEGAEPGGPRETATVVGHQVTANATFSLGLGERGMVFAGLPVTLWMDGDENPRIGSTPVASADGPGLGDAYVGARVRFFGDEESVVALGGQVAATFPSAGNDQRFRGEEFLTAVPEVLLAIRPGLDSRITLNLGGRIRRTSDDASSNLSFGSEFTYALGYAIPVWRGPSAYRHLDFHAQVFGTTNFQSVEETPMELIGGLKFFHEGGFIVGVAAGPGVTKGFGTPSARGILMLGYQMPRSRDRDGDGIVDDEDACPDDPEDVDGFEDSDGCPDPDNDQDGIPDTEDQCPLQPETVNGFEDEDGCPDLVPDSDGDGLRDDLDSCPNEPEDIDGFEDDDGCPDPDNDQDGIVDSEDRCPMEKGLASNQGCPDPDRDGDGVPDRVDNCPDEPGPAANQGCKREQKVRIESSGLVITERVYFQNARARIQQRSFSLLNDVAAVLRAHPEIEKIIVEGHTDSRGNARFNQRLSQARAESVVKYLTQQGVEGSRLEAKGYGQERLRIENARTASDHAQNRRVEFHIPRPEGSSDADRPETN